MRKRLVLAGAAVAATFAAVPVAHATTAFTEYGKDQQKRVWVYSDGPRQDITIDPSGHGNPLLTGDQPGAQRIDILDDADSFDSVPVPEAPGCWTPSAHHAQCFGDPQQQAQWRTSQCSFPPGCDWPGASGLLVSLTAQPRGDDVRLRDTPGSEPIDVKVYPTNPNGTRTVTLSSARFVDYEDQYGGRDRVFLHLKGYTPLPELGEYSQTVNQIFTGAGDDFVWSRDGTHEGIDCGDGQDVVVAGPEDYVNPSCESVATG
jgi:hypothetical protein